MEETEQGITVQEAAAHVGVARSTVNAWVKSGRVRVVSEGHRGRGAGVRIHPADVERERLRLIAESEARTARLKEGDHG